MIKQTLLTGWNFMRWLRLGLGALMAVQAWQMHDTLSGLLAGFFIFQAVSNTGCCANNNCSIPHKTDK